MRAYLALALFAATTVLAEDNCGRMERVATNFQGTVRSVTRSKIVVEIRGLQEDNLALQNGATVTIPLKRLPFAAEKTYEMQAVWLACDGTLRRFEELVPASSRTIENYEGWMEVGHRYRATAFGRSLSPSPRMPRHQMGGLAWQNADAFLPDDGQRRTVVFDVTSQRIQQRAARSWIHVLGGTIREVP